jgi:site-specific recombinase XerC
MVTGRARRVFVGCGFRYFSDITEMRVQSFLNDLRTGTEKKPGISARTFNFHLGAVKQFCRWMVKNRRATENPVDHHEPPSVKVDRRRDWRALRVATRIPSSGSRPKP